MNRFNQAVRSFIADEDGVTALEYGMIAALIAVVIATSVESVGSGVNAAFVKVIAALT